MLADRDRIFTNLYGQSVWRLDGARGLGNLDFLWRRRRREGQLHHYGLPGRDLILASLLLQSLGLRLHFIASGPDGDGLIVSGLTSCGFVTKLIGETRVCRRHAKIELAERAQAGFFGSEPHVLLGGEVLAYSDVLEIRLV